jgi:hypothetical protein
LTIEDFLLSFVSWILADEEKANHSEADPAHQAGLKHTRDPLANLFWIKIGHFIYFKVLWIYDGCRNEVEQERTESETTDNEAADKSLSLRKPLPPRYAVPIPIGKQTAYTNTNIHHVLTYDAAKIEHIMMDVPARIIILGWNLFNKKAPMGFAKAYITQLTGKMITLMAGVAFASP